MTARVFHASKYAEAVKYKEQVGGIIIRFTHPTMGVCYEVRLIPEVRQDN